MAICKHCKMPIEIRNPSGYCDHLHYPEYCEKCKEEAMENKATIIVEPIKTIEATKANEDAIILHDQAQKIVITSQPDYEIAGTLLQKIKGRYKEIEAKRKEITTPLDKTKKLIMDMFKTPLIKLGEAEVGIKRGMLTFEGEQELIRKRQEERLRLQAIAEENRKKKALEERAKKAEAEGKAEKAEELREKKEEVKVEAVALAPRTEKPQGISYREQWNFRIIDGTCIPREYLIPNEPMLRKFAIATKGKIPVVGIEFFSEKIVSSRE